MNDPRYATPAAFKQAVEQRLRNASSSGADLARRRQLLVFERFLARVQQLAGDAVVLKGGLSSNCACSARARRRTSTCA